MTSQENIRWRKNPGNTHIDAAEKAVWSWIFGLNLEFPCFGEFKSLASCHAVIFIWFLFLFCHLIFKTMWNVHSSSHGEWIQQQLKHIILLCMEDAGHLLTPDLQNNVVHLHGVNWGRKSPVRPLTYYFRRDAKIQALWEVGNLKELYFRKRKSVYVLPVCLFENDVSVRPERSVHTIPLCLNNAWHTVDTQ